MIPELYPDDLDGMTFEAARKVARRWCYLGFWYRDVPYYTVNK
ncbi:MULTISPECIES: hypothetical protein [unclassified Ruegeria]|nr:MULTISPECIES: hypothetical protein [unclassified Ruegeria]